MPTYEYRCARGHTFDAFQKMSDAPLTQCQECGEPAERIVSGGSGFLFKGDGFYITDSRSADYKKKAEAEKQPSSDAAAAEKSKNDSAAKAAPAAAPAAGS